MKWVNSLAESERVNLGTGVTRKQSTPNFPKNDEPLVRMHSCTCQGVRNVRFLENVVCFLFL